MRPLLDRLDRRLGEGPGVRVPLIAEDRLDRGLGALAERHRVADRLGLLDQPLGLEVGEHALARDEALQPPVGLGHLLVQAAARIHDVDHREIVPAPDLEVVEIVPGGDLDRARALLRIGVRVRDDRQAPPDQRQDRVFADQVPIARIVGMHRDPGIAEHGLRPGGRDRDVAPGRALDRVADVPEMAVHLGGLDLQIRDRGLQLAVPVDQPLVLVDQALAVEVDEHLAHRARQALVHGEALARPVGRGAEAMELAADQAAGALLPGPDPLDEPLPPEVAARDAFLRQLTLDHHLRRDAGVIAARLPQHRATRHAMKADQGVLDGVVEGMAHVQAAGDVRRRDDDAVGARVRIVARRKEPAFLPQPVELGLDFGGPIGLVQHRRILIPTRLANTLARLGAGSGL